MMGTAKYLSPEQVRGRQLDGRADLYSLGLVLYECLAGRVPFLGETDADTALARLQRDPTDLGRLRPTIPRGLVNLIHRLLSRNPNHRPATGAELRAELLRVADEPPPDLTPLGRPPAPNAVDHGPGRPVRPHRRARPASSRAPARARRRSPARRRRRTRSPARPRDHTPERRARPARQAGQGPAVAHRPVDGARARCCSPSPSSSPSCCGSRSAGATTTARRTADDGRRRPARRRRRPPAAPATITAITAYDPDGRRRGERRPGARPRSPTATRPRTGRPSATPRSTMGKDGVGLVVVAVGAGDRDAVVRRRQPAVPGRRVRRPTPSRRRPTSPTGASRSQTKTFSETARHGRRRRRRSRPATS